jgi:low temperature requirement protein LtrA
MRRSPRGTTSGSPDDEPPPGVANEEELLEEAVDREQRVLPLELFFDLVFVFAITQVTGFLYADPSWTRLLEGCAILAVLWFAWSEYLWLGNTAGTDVGAIRVVLLVAMGALLVVSLAVPHSFGTDALIFGVGYLFVTALHLLAYAVLARGQPALLTAVFRLGLTTLPAATALLVAGLLPGVGRPICWGVAVAVWFGGGWLSPTAGWRIEPNHLAERHAQVIIIALGESIVALGLGASDLGIHAGVLAGLLLGLVVTAALWWAYFDGVALAAAMSLRLTDPDKRVPMARDSYTFLHLPMIAGIVIFASGAKTALAHFGSHLHPLAAAALCGGIALYLLAVSAFTRRTRGTFTYPLLVAAAVLAGLSPLVTLVPASAALGIVSAVTVAAITYQTWRYADARNSIRRAVG